MALLPQESYRCLLLRHYGGPTLLVLSKKINEKKKLLKKENVKLQDLQTINEQRINTYKEFAQESEKELYKEKIKGNVKGVWGFILGVLSTSVAAYAAIRVAK